MILVSRQALKDLLLWSEDAIDFKDESDAWLVPAFLTLKEAMLQASEV